MSDLFVSYASEDREVVSDLVRELEGNNWSIWWDRRIAPGDEWYREVNRALSESHTALVIWSTNAIGSDWVRFEAATALAAGRLIPASLDGAAPPAPYSAIETADLSDWVRSRATSDLAHLTRRLAEALATTEPVERYSVQIARRAVGHRDDEAMRTALTESVKRLGFDFIATGEPMSPLTTFSRRAGELLSAEYVGIWNAGHEVTRVLGTALQFEDSIRAAVDDPGFLVADVLAIGPSDQTMLVVCGGDPGALLSHSVEITLILAKCEVL